MNFIFTKYYLQMKLPCETSFKEGQISAQLKKRSHTF